MVTTIVVVWLSSLMVSCAAIEPIKAITSSTSPTKQELLKRDTLQAEIKIQTKYHLPTQNKKFYSKSGMLRVNVMAFDGHTYRGLQYKNGKFVIGKKKKNELVLRVYFIGDKFEGAEIEKIKIRSTPYEKANGFKHYKLEDMKLEVVYYEGSYGRRTQDDEIRLITDSGGPSRFAWLVCDGQCETKAKSDVENSSQAPPVPEASKENGVITAITSSISPTKQELLGREVSPNAEIQIPRGFQLPEKKIKFSTNGEMIKVSVVAQKKKDYSSHPLSENKPGHFGIWGQGKELFIRLYFIGDKFDGGKIKKIKIGSQPYNKTKSYRYYKLKDLKLKVTYVKGRRKHTTTRADEIRLIRDYVSPRGFAWLVCDGRCEKPEQKKHPKITYKFQCSGTNQDVFESENFQDRVNACRKRLTETKEPQNMIVSVTMSPKQEKNTRRQIALKQIQIKQIQIKPYTKLYDKEHIVDCQYDLIIRGHSFRLNKSGKNYLFANLPQRITQDTPLTIKVTPSRARADCISKTFKNNKIVLNADRKPEVKIEVPHSKPWLLVYATSAEFPKDADHYRVRFWKGLFNQINDAYAEPVKNRGKAWLTGDVYMLSLDKGSELLAGKKGTTYTESLTLSSQAIKRLSPIPRSRQPSFEDYKRDILKYSKKHSTKGNRKSNNVVIIQGKASFLERTCREFEQFALKLEKADISVLYIQPVGEGGISDHARSNTLESYSTTIGYKTIYTCKSKKETASKLITFDYSEHHLDNWRYVQKSVFYELNELKQQ